MSAAEPPQGANSAPAGGSAAAKPPAWGGHTGSASDAMEPATVSGPWATQRRPLSAPRRGTSSPPAQTAEQLGGAVDGGLTAAEASQRLGFHGPNQISEAASRSKLRMLLAQFTDFMILLLIAAAIVSGFIGDAEDTIVILGIVVLNAAVGFVQEFRAERAMRGAEAAGRAERDGGPRRPPSYGARRGTRARRCRDPARPGTRFRPTCA